MAERFSASVAARHMACPASANLDLAIPGWVPPVRDPDKGAKGVGTEYHVFFANIAGLSAKDILAFSEAFAYVAAIRKTRRFNVLVEQTEEAWWLNGKPVTDDTGATVLVKPKTTADLVFFVQDEIHVFDLKTGKIEVEVANNAQLKFGAVTYAPYAPKAKGVHTHILQPWAATGCSSHFYTTTELAQFRDEAIATEAKIQAGDTTFGPSDHCKFCPAFPHSRGDKGTPLCPATLQLLYPKVVDENEILGLG